MYTDLLAPCAQCPFRTNLPGYLRGARAVQIACTLLRDESFACHKTLTYVEDTDGEANAECTPRSQHCAGAMLLLEHLALPNQWMRIAGRMGWYDPAKLHRQAPIFHTVAAFIAHHASWTDRRELHGMACGPRSIPALHPQDIAMNTNLLLPSTDQALIEQIHALADLDRSYLQYDMLTLILADQACLSDAVFAEASTIIRQMPAGGGFRAAALAELAGHAPSSEERRRLLLDAFTDVQACDPHAQDAALPFVFAGLPDDLRQDALALLATLDLPPDTYQQLQLLLTEPTTLGHLLADEEE